MKKQWIGCVLGLGLMTVGCQRERNVQNQIEDLKEAQANTGEVASDLERQLEHAKSEVLRLEEKLALARQGVTDEVLEERQELKEAVSGRQEDLRHQVNQAQEAAQQHTADVQAAQRHLDATKPARVQANLKTNTEVVPGAAQNVQVDTERREIEVDRVNVSGQEHEQPPQQPGARYQGPENQNSQHHEGTKALDPLQGQQPVQRQQPLTR